MFDNVEFHDVVATSSDVHNECLYTQSPGLTVRNSTFRDCATMDMMITRGFWWDQPRYGGLTIENNVFGHSRNGSGWHVFGLLLHGQMGQFIDARVVNNTFETLVGGFTTTDITGATSGVWANNIGGGWDCLPGMTFAGNVGKKCGASDVAVSPSSSCGPPSCGTATTMPVGWVNPPGTTSTCGSTSPAINAGSATACAGARPRRQRAAAARPTPGLRVHRRNADPDPDRYGDADPDGHGRPGHDAADRAAGPDRRQPHADHDQPQLAIRRVTTSVSPATASTTARRASARRARRSTWSAVSRAAPTTRWA